VWILLTQNSSGAIVLALVFTSQATAVAYQTALMPDLPPGVTTAIYQTPAPDPVFTLGPRKFGMNEPADQRALLQLVDAVRWHVDGLRARVALLEDLLGTLLLAAAHQGFTDRERFAATLAQWRAGLVVDPTLVTNVAAVADQAAAETKAGDDPLLALRAQLAARLEAEAGASAPLRLVR
jgi:hypothetical protein